MEHREAQARKETGNPSPSRGAHGGQVSAPLPIRATLPARSNLLYPFYVLSLIAFWLAGGIGGLWTGEQLWHWLDVETSFLTVYADMAFILAGILVGALVCGWLVMHLESFLFSRWLERVNAVIDAGNWTPSPDGTQVNGSETDNGETAAANCDAEQAAPCTHTTEGPRSFRPKAKESKARFGSRAFQRVTRYDQRD